MAPCSSRYSSIHRRRLSEKDNIKLRKPIVEKMRRDRINGCIEQLKIILEKEFHRQEPNSKLEKADILEMTVSFLRQQLRPGLGRGGCRQGCSLQEQQRRERLHESHKTSGSSPVALSPAPMWRPW